MTTVVRAVHFFPHIEQAPHDQLIVKYMSWKKFRDLVTQSALYFRRIDKFEDTYEGTIPLAVWSLNNAVIREWYDRCKEEVFVSCWNMDEEETPEMWREYAEGYGVRIASAASSLVAELSYPPVPPLPPYDQRIVEMAQRTGVTIAEVDERPQDSFVVGRIRYINFDNVDVHELLDEGPSNVVPAFRKRAGYVRENEFRAVLCPSSASGNAARGCGDVHVFVPIRLQNLIQEIRYAPADDGMLASNIRTLLADNGLNVPVNPADVA
jgi:hypothetical protein